MKKYIFILFSIAALSLIGCDDILDRPQKTKPVDDTFWRNETDFRLYANQCYANYFTGYSSTWGVDYAPLRGYYFSDDIANAGTQQNMENSVPSSRGSTSLSPNSDLWLTKYGGATWNFAWVRKINIMIERLESPGKDNLSEEAYNHWMGVARFFRAFEYYRLVCSFGDVPYYDKTFLDTDKDEMYKDRTPRVEVMEHVYDDLKFAFDNLRVSDGAMYLNKDIAAGFITRFMLFEGTWQKYHNINTNAKKYLEFAKDAGDYLIGTKKYAISGDFRSLFGSFDLKGHKEVLMYRHYDAANATHHVASYSNGYESQGNAINLAAIKSFICNDGKPYQSSGVTNADKFDCKNLSLTRDPRFEATFWDTPHTRASTLLYASKFIDREGPTYWNAGSRPAQYDSFTNTNDFPVMRYSEVLLNWIEAKAELAESYEGVAITQADINTSINAIRNRDLDAVAIGKGVKKTAPMELTDIDNSFDPARDSDVSALIWEIRRERRMEFIFEHARIDDIRRWKKIHYMDNEKYPDTMTGPWVNLKEDVPAYLEADDKGDYQAHQVRKMDGTVVTYDGTNADDMVGFFIPLKAQPRNPFSDIVYLAPVGKAQIDQYADQGYTLTQTKVGSLSW